VRRVALGGGRDQGEVVGAERLRRQVYGPVAAARRVRGRGAVRVKRDEIPKNRCDDGRGQEEEARRGHPDEPRCGRLVPTLRKNPAPTPLNG